MLRREICGRKTGYPSQIQLHMLCSTVSNITLINDKLKLLFNSYIHFTLEASLVCLKRSKNIFLNIFLTKHPL